MAGTVVMTKGRSGNTRTITFTCVGHATGGAIPDTVTTAPENEFLRGFSLYKAEIYPGTPAPTANSDVYLKTSGGVDLLGGNGVDALDAATVSDIPASVDGQSATQPINQGDTLTLSVENQAVNSAQYVIVAFFQKTGA